MLDRLPAWLRHVLIGTLYSVLTIGLPVLVDHQEDLRDLIVRDLHLPLIAASIVGGLIAQAILYFTKLETQYGVGSTNPPTVPVIDPSTGPDVPTQADGMAGYGLVEALLAVFLVVVILLVLVRLL
jgi:hypothetical protein